MVRCARVCLQATLKAVNSVLGFAGMGMILYSLWLIRVWYRHTAPASASPWFMYTFLGLGISLCLITCSGYVAVETANGHCLSCGCHLPIIMGLGCLAAMLRMSLLFCHYVVVIFLLIMLEAGIASDVFLNRNWDEDFPDDPSGKFNEFKDFVRSNFEMCKWIGLSIVSAQAMSIILAFVLRFLGPEGVTNYDSDDDYIPARLPLLRNQSQQARRVVDPSLSQKNGPWNC